MSTQGRAHHFVFEVTDDNPVGDLFPAFMFCEGCPLCTDDPEEDANE